MSYVDQVLQQPPGSEWLSPKNKIGHLLAIFDCLSQREEPDPMNPGKLRTVAEIVYADLSDGEGGRIVWGAQVDKPGIVNKLKNQRGTILGRLELGDAKAGQSAPYILQDHTPEDAAYFTGTWLPANRAALDGKQPQRAASQAPTTPAAAPAAPAAPAPQPSAPPAQQYVPAPAATAAFPGQVVPAPQPVAAQVPQVPQVPQPVAVPAGNGSLASGQGQPYSPETIAAIERMVASGQLPAFPVPQ